MTVTPEPGNRDERPQCAATIWPSWADRWIRCTGAASPDGYCSAYGGQHQDANRAAAAAAQPTGGERYPCYCLPGPARCDEPHAWCDRPAPSAGQDTGQLRDEIARGIAAEVECLDSPLSDDDWDYYCDEGKQQEYLDQADALLSGPLARLVAERDEARATVERVGTVLTTWPQFHGKCECGPEHLLRELRFALDGRA